MQFEPLPEKRRVPAFVKRVIGAGRSAGMDEIRRGGAGGFFADACARTAARGRPRGSRSRCRCIASARSDDAYIRGLHALLTDRNVEILTYEGEALTAELENAADIIEWLPAAENETEVRCGGD